MHQVIYLCIALPILVAAQSETPAQLRELGDQALYRGESKAALAHYNKLIGKDAPLPPPPPNPSFCTLQLLSVSC
jgi:hypothetical protein